jgi:DNA helicase HerA-like ATPase
MDDLFPESSGSELAHKQSGGYESTVQPVPAEALTSITNAVPWAEPEEYAGSVGRTMFDSPTSKDNTLTVLLAKEEIERVPAQSLVRIESVPDKRTYLGIVVAGPFAEPDGLRADAPAIVTTTVRGGIFMPRFHGRLQVEILGEKVASGFIPPRFRPLPNSPVFVLGSAESAELLRLEGDLRLGVAAGDEEMIINIPSSRKSVLPRHTGILGTTGGGKSTTVSRLIEQAQRQGYAIVLLDTEGEYTTINEATEDPVMLAALQRRGFEATGVKDTHIYHLIDKDTSNPSHPDIREFSLSFASLSPYTVEEILDLGDPQRERFERAYDTTKLLLRDLGVFPRKVGNRPDSDEDRQALELNEFEGGYPRMVLDHLLDVIQIFHDILAKEDPKQSHLLSTDFRRNRDVVIERVEQQAGRTSHVLSWRGLLGRIYRIRRLGIFDRSVGLDHAELLEPGRVSILDLSDTDSPVLNNLVIADILRGVQRQQDLSYRQAEQGKQELTKVLIIIEEAHEFISDDRISKMPNLFEQVTRIAKRGRKRWLGLVFVTQLPQHLPREVLGLINNFVLHKINDSLTVSRLKGSIAGIDEALWNRLPGLAPGQAIVSFTSMARPLLVTIDPTPAKLRLID